MSSSLALVEEAAPSVESEESVMPQGRLAKLVYKVRELKRKIGAVEQFSHLAQLCGLGSLSWLVGFVGSILILNRFVSPVITELAMTTLIAPIAALVLVVLGEFDFTKLTTMMISNVGIVFATGGIITAALFVQNVVKMALLAKSFTSQSHKQYRTYALASMLTPVTTSAFWYLATKLGYFLGAKSISLGVLAIFASGVVGEALNNVDPVNATAADLAAVANAMSNGLRWGLGFLIGVHLFFVFKSYGLVHRTLNVFFSFVAKKATDNAWRQRVWSVLRNHWGKLFVAFGLIPALSAAAISCVPTDEEWAQVQAEEAQAQALVEARAWRVFCDNGITYATEQDSAYRLTNTDGSSHCLSAIDTQRIVLGEPYFVGNTYRNEIVLKYAAGYDQECLIEHRGHDHPVNGQESSGETYDCRKDLTVPRSVRYWQELLAGLPEGVTTPPLPPTEE